jgi:hypothetical protein
MNSARYAAETLVVLHERPPRVLPKGKVIAVDRERISLAQTPMGVKDTF